jgi:hypothetical protein
MHEKMWFICTMKYCSTLKKNEISPFAAMWMNLKEIMLSEINQAQKGKYYMIWFIYKIKNKLISQK